MVDWHCHSQKATPPAPARKKDEEGKQGETCSRLKLNQLDTLLKPMICGLGLSFLPLFCMLLLGTVFFADVLSTARFSNKNAGFCQPINS